MFKRNAKLIVALLVMSQILSMGFIYAADEEEIIDAEQLPTEIVVTEEEAASLDVEEHELKFSLQTNEIVPLGTSVTYGDYQFDAATGTITKYVGSSVDVVIPDMINGVTVKAIDWFAFYSKKDVKIITIPAGVESIVGNDNYLSQYTLTSLEAIYVDNSNMYFSDIDGVLFNKDKTTLFEYPCAKGTAYTVPNGVTEIGKAAFLFVNIETVTLPEGLKVIGQEAFYETNLKSVNMPDGITSIGMWAFTSTPITELILPDSIEYIGESAFTNCYNLTSVVLPKEITSIPYGIFYGCYSLTSVTMPNGVLVIEDEAFYNCESLSEVNLNEGLRTIGNNTFYSCIKLSSIKLPNSLTSIGVAAFSGCPLSIIVIPSKVSRIDSYAFSYSKLTSATFLGDAPTNVGVNVFSNAATGFTIYYHEGAYGFTTTLNLAIYPTKFIFSNDAYGDYKFAATTGTITKYLGNDGDVIIPDTINGVKVTAIGEEAFYQNTSLISVAIPDSVTSIGNYAFAYCTALQSATIPNSITSINSYTFAFCNSLSAIAIPDSVTSIGDRAFTKCDSLSTITIPNSVTSIGRYSFSHCESLRQVTLNEGLRTIGNSAFSSCKELTVIKLPSSLTSIGSSAFSGCSLSSIIIPANVTNIGNYAFSPNYDLAFAKFLGDAPTYFGVNIFYGAASDFVVYYYEGAYGFNIEYSGFDQYTCEMLPRYNVNDFEFDETTGTITKYIGSDSEVIIPDKIGGIKVKAIGNEAFYQNKNLTSIVMPNSLLSIGEDAFTGCYYLEEVVLNEGLQSIGDYAFTGCRILRTIDLPDSITNIGEGAFGISGLTSIVLPKNLTEISDFLFSGCKWLASVTIPSSVVSIGYEAFYKCEVLEEVILSEGLQTIGKSAFWYCTALETIKLPNSLRSINDFAFISTAIKSIEFPANITSIGSVLFGSSSSLMPNPIKSVTFLGNAPTNVGASVFAGTSDDFIVYFYEGAIGFSTPYWNNARCEMIKKPIPAGIPLILSNTVALSGDYVEVDFKIGADSNMDSMVVEIEFDSDYLTVENPSADIKFTDLLDGYEYYNVKDSKVYISYANSNAKLTQGGKIATIKFKAAEAVEQMVTNITMDVTTFSTSTSPLNHEDIPYTIENGSVTITPWQYGNVTNSGKVSADDALDVLYIATGKIDIMQLTPVQRKIANVYVDYKLDKDGKQIEKIDATDAAVIQKYVVKIIDKLPVYPE